MDTSNKLLWSGYIYLMLVYFGDGSNLQTPEGSTPPSTNTHIFINLKEIGYSGTWEDFCSTLKMDLDFPNDPNHEIRACREMICELRNKNEITWGNVHVFVVYKFMAQVRPVVEDLSTHLVGKFSGNNLELLDRLVNPPVHVSEHKDPECHKTIMTVFQGICLNDTNPYYEMFDPFFERICGTGLVAPKDMVKHIVDECRDKAGLLQWNYEKILSSIHYQVIT